MPTRPIVVTALPKTHEATLSKSDAATSSDTFELVLINLSGEELEDQCVRNATINSTAENAIYPSAAWPEAAWKPPRGRRVVAAATTEASGPARPPLRVSPLPF